MSEDQTPRSRKPSRSFFRITVKTMMILVATSSLVIWSAKRVWEDATQNPYIRVLQFGDIADRRIAARQLIATPRSGEAQKVVGALTLGLRDPDAEVRTASTNSLGSVVRDLLDRWKTSPEALRVNQPLVSSTSRALIGVLNDSDNAIKAEALRALIAIHFRNASRTNVLAEPVCMGIDPIDETLPHELRAALVKALGDQSPEVRGLAAVALGDLGPFLSHDIPPELLEAMSDTAMEVRQHAALACASYKECLSPLLPDLFARLERAHPPYRYPLRLCLERGKADLSLVPLLRDRLRSPSPDVRYCAARMLAGLGANAAAASSELLTVLNEPFTAEKPRRTPPDEQPDPASAALWALSEFPLTQEFIDALARNLRSDVPGRRSSAAVRLGSIGPAARKAIPALIAALQAQLKSDAHKHESVAYEFYESGVVAYAIGSIGTALGKIAPDTEFADQAMTVLVEALRSSNPNMRVPAAEALGRFGPAAKLAIPTLKGLTNDSAFAEAWRQEVRQAARKAIAAIEGTPVASGYRGDL